MTSFLSQRSLSLLEELSPDLYEESKRSKIWRTYRWGEINEMQVNRSNI